MPTGKIIAFFSALLLLPACVTSKTYPVYIESMDSNETFTGMTTARLFGESSFSVKSEENIVCSGEYQASVLMSATDTASDAGPIQCSDGRTGRWSAVGTPDAGGKGIGKLEGDRIRVYYGNMIPKGE